MKKKSLYHRNRQMIVALLALLFLLGPGFMARAQEQDPIKHEVAVKRMLIPVFAYDKKGKPVEDLKLSEITLLVNGKPMSITDMHRIKFTHEEAKRDSATTPAAEPKVSAKPQRVVFLVLDSMYNSFYGLKKAKKVASKLVESKTLGTEFVIIEHSMFGGLKLLGGPESNTRKLKKYIKNVSRISAKERVESFDITNRNPAINPKTDFNALGNHHEKKHQKQQTKFFVDFMAQLKYTLQAITKPKLVFFMSEGFSEILFYETNSNMAHSLSFDPDILYRLNQLVQEINAGGSMMYSVFTGRMKNYKQMYNNSPLGKGGDGGLWEELGFTLENMDVPISKLSGVESLKTISEGTGGRLFEGSTQQIIENVESMTAAYYELAFSPAQNSRNTMRIKVKCTRPGVTIDAIARTVKRESYKEMERLQKKVFALNLMQGREWARLMANKIEKIPFTSLAQAQHTVRVPIPQQFKEKVLDVFQVSFQDDFSKPEIKMKRIKAADSTAIEYKKFKEASALYFLIIDPETTYCMYNRIF